jgi:hypothetical protein
MLVEFKANLRGRLDGAEKNGLVGGTARAEQALCLLGTYFLSIHQGNLGFCSSRCTLSHKVTRKGVLRNVFCN